MIILTIEDSLDLQLLYKTIIKMAGHEAIDCGTAQEARAYLLQNKAPDLIIMDLTLPDLEPDGLHGFFNEVPHFQKIPLILSSGRDDLQVWARKLGAFHALKKPVEVSVLRNFLKDFAKTSSSSASI